MDTILHEHSAAALGTGETLATASDAPRNDGAKAQTTALATRHSRSAHSDARGKGQTDPMSGGSLGTSANNVSTRDFGVFQAERKRLYGMRAMSARWLTARALEAQKGLTHIAGDFFVHRDSGEIVEKKFIRPPRPATCSWSIGRTVTIEKKNDVAFYGDIQHCSSIWACPVCASTIRKQRAREITTAVEAHQKNGGEIAFLTLTLRHHREDSLEKTLDAVMEGWRNLMRGRRWRDLKKTFNIVGYIRAIEVTYSQENGWHPHAHILLFFGKNSPLTTENLKILESDIFTWWEKWCEEKTGRTPTREHGIDVQKVDTKGRVLSRYLSKVQTEKEKKWTAAAELSRTDIKRGRTNSFTPFQLLENETSLSEQQRYALWTEYVDASKGRRAITWSRGLKDLYGVEEISDDQVIEEEERGSIPRYIAMASRYQKALRAGRAVTVLEAAENENWKYVSREIPGILLPEPPPDVSRLE